MSDPHMNDRTPGHPRGAGRLRRAVLLVAAAGVLAAATAVAEPRLVTIELSLESGTELVALPATPGGTLSVRECSACQTLRLKFDAQTRYYIGDEAVSYARLRHAASGDSRRLDVFYRPDSGALTRLRLVAGANPQ